VSHLGSSPFVKNAEFLYVMEDALVKIVMREWIELVVCAKKRADRPLENFE
jgi:hypothetical protein